MKKSLSILVAVAALGACHSEETRERIRNGDLERSTAQNDIAPQNSAAPAP